jgi:hypothetical protein
MIESIDNAFVEQQLKSSLERYTEWYSENTLAEIAEFESIRIRVEQIPTNYEWRKEVLVLSSTLKEVEWQRCAIGAIAAEMAKEYVAIVFESQKN